MIALGLALNTSEAVAADTDSINNNSENEMDDFFKLSEDTMIIKGTKGSQGASKKKSKPCPATEFENDINK